MIEHRTLGHWLRRFLAEYIVTERRLARNTQKSYRDSFTLLLPFLGKTARKPVDRLAVADLTAKRALAFLDHLEQERGCSAQTRNQRLAAIRSFARFVASRDPAQVDWSAQIRSLAAKKTTAKPVSWMTKDEVEALLAVPDRRTSRGRTEHALVLFLYNTGARVSEVTGLRAGDVRSGDDGRYPLANLNGKGGKVRQCPLWRRTVEALAELMKGRPRRCRGLPQQPPQTLHPVRRLSSRRAVCGRRAGTGGPRDYPPPRTPHHRLPPPPGRRGSEHHPCLARTCQPRNHQCLRRDRS